MKLGTVKNHGYDADGRELRERLDAIAECPTCRKRLELWSETTAWTETRDKRWRHDRYGPASEVCCDNLICLDFNGFRVYRWPPPEKRRKCDAV